MAIAALQIERAMELRKACGSCPANPRKPVSRTLQARILTTEEEPGDYEPGEYEPGEYEPGEYEPGQYEMGDYEIGPADYEPGQYELGDYEPGEYVDDYEAQPPTPTPTEGSDWSVPFEFANADMPALEPILAPAPSVEAPNPSTPSSISDVPSLKPSAASPSAPSGSAARLVVRISSVGKGACTLLQAPFLAIFAALASFALAA
jgi:hypothetical protein